MYENDELYHHGILGQKWGIRRFQPYPKGVKKGKEVGEASRKVLRSGTSEGPISRAKNILQKRDQKRRLEEDKQKEQDRINRQKEKERVLKEGTATEVLKYKNELTTQQLKDASERIQWTNKLSAYSEQEKRKAFNTIDKYMKTAKSVNDWVSTGLSTKKNIDSIMDILEQSSKKSKKKQK